MSIAAIVCFFAFLLGTFLLQATNSAFRVLEQTQSTEQLKATDYLFGYRAIQNLFIRQQELEALFFCIGTAKQLCRFGLAVSATVIVYDLWEFFTASTEIIVILITLVALLISLAIGDFLPRILGVRHPTTILKAVGPLASLYLVCAAPISLPLLALAPRPFLQLYSEQVIEPVEHLSEKIIEMLHQAEVHSTADAEERQLIESVVTLRDTIVREIMIPRLEMFCLESRTTARQAAPLLDEEGYSRVPVYTESVDKIIGVLLHKDIASLYTRAEANPALLDTPIAELVKPILYVPEMSRVSRLLQDFRKQQTHLAIVVDEYGGTEGLVTIEDCLEEIVGEIADEFDDDEALFSPIPTGGWIVDARMTINDIEEHFDLKIPQEGEYDTIGGYAFHKAGEIPPKGLQIHHDDFDLEILESSDRCVEKVSIIPTSTTD